MAALDLPGPMTQRSYFSDSGVPMLSDSAAIRTSITTSALCSLWSHVETTSSAQVITEFCACLERAVCCPLALKDTGEQWYAAGGEKPSSEDSTFQSGLRILTVEEDSQDDYVPVSAPCVNFLVA